MDDVAYKAGAVYVFERENGAWVEKAKLEKSLRRAGAKQKAEKGDHSYKVKRGVRTTKKRLALY